MLAGLGRHGGSELGNLQQLDALNAWLRMAIRSAAIAFADGRLADDAFLKTKGHEKGSGVRVKWAFLRMEREAAALLDAISARVGEFDASQEQVVTAASAVQEFLGSMAQDVRALAQRMGGGSVSVTTRTDELIESLERDAGDMLALARAKARKQAEAPERLRAKPGPKPDLAWRDKVLKFCAKAGREYVASQDVGMRAFLHQVKVSYGMAFDEGPRDYRATHEIRQEWLDRQAGIAG